MVALISMVNPRKRILVLIFNLALVGLLCLFILPAAWLPGLVRYGSMPVLALALAFFAVSLLRQLRRLPPQAYKKRFSPSVLLIVVAAIVFQFVHEDFGYKVLMDEYNLTATSLSMHQDRSAFTPTQGRIIQGEFVVVDGYVDKRPMLYPLLLSLVHDLTGYRITNPHLLNAGLSILLFLVVYLAGFHLGDKRGGILAVLLLAGWPLLAQNATGAGFEILNFLLLALVLFLTLSLTNRPGLEKETLLIYSAVLLANVRYESIIFLAPVVVVLGARWMSRKNLGPAWASVWAPWFLAPLLLQNRWFRSQEKLWELAGETDTPFSLSSIADNIGHAAVYFFNTSSEFPNSLLLTLAGGVSLFFLLIVSAKRSGNWVRLQPEDYDVLGLWAVALMGHFVLILAYHIGKLDSHFATRLGMPVHLILILAPVWLLVKEKLDNRVWNIGLCLSVIFIFAFAGPHSSQAVFTKKNYAEREFHWIKKRLVDYSPSTFLVIDTRESYWVCMRWQSLQMQLAKANQDKILEALRAGEYTQVFVVQRISIDPGRESSNVLEDDRLPGFKLQVIDEYASRPFSGTRLSRLVLE